MQPGIIQNELDLNDKHNTDEPNQPKAFTNKLIDALPTPSLAQISQTSISKSYIKAKRYIRLTTTLILIMLLSFAWWFAPIQSFITVPANIRLVLLFGIMACAFLGGLSIIYGLFADKRKFYAIREHDISYTSGVFFKNTVSQPVLRIQHVELRRGPIDRKLNLANLQVFSAGGALHTFEIPGLELIEAQKIRQFILGHKDISHENTVTSEVSNIATKTSSTESQIGELTETVYQGNNHDQ
jgi:hypothetical protein